MKNLQRSGEKILNDPQTAENVLAAMNTDEKDNSGFEKAASAWGNWQSTVAATMEKKHSGEQSWKVTQTESGKTAYSEIGNVPVKPNTEYVCEAWVTGSAISGITMEAKHQLLEDMIEFDEVDFNKKISVSIKDKYIIKSKYAISKLEPLCVNITDGSHNPPVGVDSSKYMMLSSRNIVDGNINFEQARFLSATDFEKEDRRTQVQEGDVLLTIVGAIGRTAVVGKNVKNITFQRSVAVLKPNTFLLDSEYLRYYLEAINQVIQVEAHGLAQKGIYLNQITEIM